MPVNRLISCLIAFVCLGTMFESASAQSPWRTRYVRRDGLFHVEKYRTGNGITPAFAGVLSTAIETFGPIAASFAGREAPPEAKTRDLPSDWLQQYTVEQRRANDLLERTARLVNYGPPVGGAPPSVAPSVVQPGNLEQEFGNNPWKDRPQ